MRSVEKIEGYGYKYWKITEITHEEVEEGENLHQEKNS